MASVDRANWGLRRVLERWQLDQDVIIETIVVVNELLTNAVQHARTDWQLVVQPHGPLLHIAVTDGLVGPVPRTARPRPGRLSGLRLVNTIALRWGWQEHQTGKTVWAELVA